MSTALLPAREGIMEALRIAAVIIPPARVPIDRATGRFLPTHGESHFGSGKQTTEYSAWFGMVARCCNPKHKAYARYGGRGIRVFPAWRESYPAFLADVGRKPTPAHSLDRHPNPDGNYEPGNVRWARSIDQNRNRSSNHFIVINGERKCLSEWLEILKISRGAFQSRKQRGLSAEEALLLGPPRPKRPLVVPANHRQEELTWQQLML